MSSLRVQVQRLRNSDGLDLPTYATPASAGMDLLAATDGPMSILPGERAMVATGVAIALPTSYEAQVRPRSGTIDADYRGEIGVILINHGNENFTIERGMRIAQIVFAKVHTADWEEVAELPESVRAEGGFGSTGL
jgi:dUTP pyrophosphatase